VDDALAWTSATEQSRLIRDRQVKSRELVDLYLDRIARYDGDLNSYVHLLGEAAQRLADDKDAMTVAGGELPPLHGVPLSIKELDWMAGAPATMATRVLAGNVSSHDDAPIRRLRAAGIVPLGKTNAPELGTTPWTEPDLFGPCRNPWDPGRTPGGSSGGAAAALAAGLCPASNGSDGGGSIRIPAAACGVFGLKPTRDRISNGPLLGSFGFELSTRGPITRTVTDAALLLGVMAGAEPGDPGLLPEPARPWTDEVGADPGRLRVGIFAASPFGHLAPPVQEAMRVLRGALEEVGHDTVDIDVVVGDDIAASFEAVWAAMVASQPFPTEQYEPLNQWLAARGRALTGGDVYGAEFRLALYCRQLVARFHGEFDLMALPVLTALPPAVGHTRDLDPEDAWAFAKDLVGATPMVNATGQPAAAIPIHWDPETGLPVGVQLVGRFADEATVLRVAAQLEAARQWADRRPAAYA
jgi:amidase